MGNTLKELATTIKVVTQTSLERVLTEMKNYIDVHDAASDAAAAQVQANLDTLIGAQGDVDKVINTFNEIKAFFADYSEDDTLKSLLDAIDTAISGEQTRAEGAEDALGNRIKAIEDIDVMTSQEAKDIFDEVFNPGE